MNTNAPPVFIDDDWAKDTCKLGQGAACCRYLTIGANGWSCEKHSTLHFLLDARVESGTINARGDNCEGRASR